MEFVNEQELFDHCVGSVIAQGEPSIDIRGKCVYRQFRDGKRLCCVAGFAIDSDEYHEGLEDKNLGYGEDAPHAHAEYNNLMHAMQRAHDGSYDSLKYDNYSHESWLALFIERVKKVARDYSLKWNFFEGSNEPTT